jgi:hypothetical protein
MDPHGNTTDQYRMVAGIVDSHPENRVFYWAEGGFGVADRKAAVRIVNRVSSHLADAIVAGRIMADEPPAPHDDEHQHGDPMAATLSDRTLDKVLSRPAHVPAIVMLDRDAAAQHLAIAAADMLAAGNLHAAADARAALRQALADYRETTA